MSSMRGKSDCLFNRSVVERACGSNGWAQASAGTRGGCNPRARNAALDNTGKSREGVDGDTGGRVEKVVLSAAMFAWRWPWVLL